MFSQTNDEDDVHELITCQLCGKFVPIANLTLHTAICPGITVNDGLRRRPSAMLTRSSPNIIASEPNMMTAHSRLATPDEIMINDVEEDMINSNFENVLRTERGMSTGGTLNILEDLIQTQERVNATHNSNVRRQRFEVEPIDVDDVDNEVMEVRDVVNLLNDEGHSHSFEQDDDHSIDLEDDDDYDEEDEWSCRACTLLNSQFETICDACNTPRFAEVNVRPADQPRRERLIDIDDPQTQTENDVSAEVAAVLEAMSPPPSWTVNVRGNPSSPSHSSSVEHTHTHQHARPITTPRLMGSGAFLGGLVGGTSAYMNGSSIQGGALEGAISGLAGGAILGGMIRDLDGSNSNSHGASAAGSGGTAQRPTAYQRDAVTTRTITTRSASRANSRYSSNGLGLGPGMGGMSPGLHHRAAHNGTGTVASTNDLFLQYMLGTMLDHSNLRGMPRGGGRNIDGMTYEQLLERFGDGNENRVRGASADVIASLPTTVVPPKKIVSRDDTNGAANADTCTHKQLSDDLEDDRCTICLDDYCPGERVKTLPCRHNFHSECLEKWLSSNGSCPICKHSLLT